LTFLLTVLFRTKYWLPGGQVKNQLNDIAELEDGSLIVVCWQNETNDNQSLRDLWALRFGPDGCLYQKRKFGQFTTSA